MISGWRKRHWPLHNAECQVKGDSIDRPKQWVKRNILFCREGHLAKFICFLNRFFFILGFHSWMSLAYSSDSFILPLPWALNKRFSTSHFPPAEWSGSGLNLTTSPSFATCVSTPLYLTVSTVLCNLPLNLLRRQIRRKCCLFLCWGTRTSPPPSPWSCSQRTPCGA